MHFLVMILLQLIQVGILSIFLPIHIYKLDRYSEQDSIYDVWS